LIQLSTTLNTAIFLRYGVCDYGTTAKYIRYFKNLKLASYGGRSFL